MRPGWISATQNSTPPLPAPIRTSMGLRVIGFFGEHGDQRLAAPLDEARDAATGRFDLTRGQLTVRRRLEAVLAKAHEIGIECQAVITTLMPLAVLGTLRVQ